MSESPSSAPRVKRQKLDKFGRFAALAKLKELKGSKHKYEVSEEVDNVYEEVDEKEYAKRLLERAGDDWIEDDGTGYMDDGREIFDDDDDEIEISKNKKSGKDGSKKRIRDKSTSNKNTLKNLFSNAVSKKKEVSIKLDDDDILADILGEISDTPLTASNMLNKKNQQASSVSIKQSKQSEDKLVKEYMQSFNNSIKKTNNSSKADGNASDDEMLERILKPEKNQSVSTRTPQFRENIVKPIKRIEEDPIEIKAINETPVTPTKQLKTSPLKVTPVKTIANQLTEEDYILNDMDLSILDDAENQIDLKSSEFETKKNNAVEEPSEKFLLTGWNNIKIDETDNTIEGNEQENIILGNKTEMKIWYWDAWEDPVRCPGQVYLFGRVIANQKTNEYQSVCVHIKSVEKCLFLLPREYIFDLRSKESTKTYVKLKDVYDEFNEKIAPALDIDTFRSRKVSKKFPFTVNNVEVPEECEYLEVRYSGKHLSPNLKKKYSSIAHIFGTNTTSLETFLLEKKIKGPCWLNIQNFVVNERPLSWCKLELNCPDINSIQLCDDKNTSPVPLTLITLNIRTALNQKTTRNEIVMIGCLVNNKFNLDKPPNRTPFQRHFCGFTRPATQIWPSNLAGKLKDYKDTTVTKLESERALLGWFLATYQKIDPDLIITHDANDCQLDVICERLMSLKINLWSRIGRLRMSNAQGYKFKDFFTGRMICDIKLSAEELIKSKSYDLDTLCTNVLKISDGERMDVSNDELYSLYENGDGILKLISLTMQDCLYTIRLMCELNVLPLALQITSVCGNQMGRTLQGGRSERNEFYLLHAFTEKNYIVPDKRGKIDGRIDENENAEGGTKKKSTYSGGLVLDPVKGFYDKFILLMDFNSLYPSIIQEYNICFTTVTEPNEGEIATIPEPGVEVGVLPRQIRRLVESRREVKKLMNNPDLEPDLRMQYNIRQLALKLTANSMYGCLGFSYSRFYAQHLAALVTHKGREILVNTKSLVQKLNYEVIYGDTDSIMINTNVVDYDQVFKIGNNIKQSVNKIYKQVELEIDGVFKRLLLLKKKKYAALTIEKMKKGEFIEKQELKGLDIVRRDWSQIAIISGKLVVNELLSDSNMDAKIDNIRLYLEKVGNNLRENITPLPFLVISKQLTKAPTDYINLTSAPHVSVALRMNSTKNKRYKKGDVIGYIICKDGTDNPAMKRAYHLEELKSREDLSVDIEYYLAHQVHVVVARLLEVIEDIDSFRIAEMLGIDPSKYKNISKPKYDQIDHQVGESIIESNLYESCEKFSFICVTCKTKNEISSGFRFDSALKMQVAVLQKCVNNDCQTAPYRYINGIRNSMILSIRDCIKRFYENWLVCDNPACNNNTRIFTHIVNNNRPTCLTCREGVLYRQYTPGELNDQLCFYLQMFDLSKYSEKLTKMPTEITSSYNLMKRTIESFISISQYRIINLKDFFMLPGPKKY